MSVEPGTRTQRGPAASKAAVEASDAPAGKLGLALAALIVMLLVLCAVIAGTMLWFDHDAPPPGAPATSRPPEPRLQVAETDQRHALETAALANLKGIDAAMRQTVAAGWGDGR